MLDLDGFVTEFAAGLKKADSERPVCTTARHTFQPGIGPFPESEAISRALAAMSSVRPGVYTNARPQRYLQSRATCDLVIPHVAAVEFKLVRPFGDNGKEAEHWSQNLLHPYPGNVSLLADCLKLRECAFDLKGWVIAFGYEHTPPQIRLEPTLRAFEAIADAVMSIQLSARSQVVVEGLVHPCHQRAVVAGWSVLS